MRCIRSDHYKLIYNCTPHQAVAPVDSQRDSGWQDCSRRTKRKRCRPRLSAYFTLPRSTVELYDLDADPGELNNLSGNAELAKVEQELKEALAEKMILDWDFLPLPAC